MAEQPSFDYSLLSWNVSELNNPTKQEEIKQVVQLHNPMVIYL
jgi:hypothetical protein